MPRLIQDLHNPVLKFNYIITFPEFDNYKFPEFLANSVNLPKWTIANNWRNQINIDLYNFEMKNDIQSLLIKLTQRPLGNKIRINMLAADASIFGYWDIVTDIEVFDFGDMSWKSDDINSVTLKLLPTTCEYVNLLGEPSKIYYDLGIQGINKGTKTIEVCGVPVIIGGTKLNPDSFVPNKLVQFRYEEDQSSEFFDELQTILKSEFHI